MKFASPWMDPGVEQAFAALRAKVSAPVSIELWDGRVFALGPDSRVRMKLPTAASLKHLLRPTLGSLAEAYVEGELEIDGPLRDVIRGVLPFVGLMFVAVFLICFFPAIATLLPDLAMGRK